MTKHIYFLATFLFLTFIPLCASAQTPTISPAFFTPNTPITVTYDVTGTTLSSLTEAYIWVWIPGANLDAQYNINPATAAANPSKFTKSVLGGRTVFTITFTPFAFFTASITGQTKLGILLKGTNFTDGQTADYISNFWDGNYQLQLTSPTQVPVFVDTNDQVTVSAATPVSSTFELFINNVSITTNTGATTFSYVHTVTETSGFANVRLEATDGVTDKEVAFQYIIGGNSPSAVRPSGTIAGINYLADATKVRLCLWAPGKNSVYAVGDFSNWVITTDYLMKKDGEFFWIELSGLTPGTEYAFRYLVDETIIVSDPYADKILDSDDQFIPATTYPNLKAFPEAARSSKWYENRTSVFQTAQTPYNWQVTNFEKPAKEKLVVYELLIRDFFDTNHRNYQSLIDTIGYFKRLGVNAIQLMPIMEFNGNEGWGYNPTFMFAPDKYYGTKNKFKEFIDVCHQNDIAVILDIAMNHQDVPNTYAAMYFDYSQFRPTANNPWFNVTPRHPFNVFFDMNHESSYTKAYLDTINHYWLNEYKVDGFRFDLSKGFTQRNTGSDVGAWSGYDASRVALLKRMSDVIWSHTPNAYVILEHLGENQEERELAEYRSTEGKGMMLWGKMTEPYNQNTMGYASNSDISRVTAAARGWTPTAGVVGYMESHDEERLMVKNLSFGKVTDGYSVKDLNTALKRMPAAFATFVTIPGPKMIWQFGEYGYDQSINRCTDGSITEDCRLTPKPVLWNYLQDENRVELFDKVSDLLRLRASYDVFSIGTPTFSNSSSLMKAISIKNKPYTDTPADSSEMNVQIVANFDVVTSSVEVNFPHTGVWYDYANGGGAVTVTANPVSIALGAGRYSIFTDVLIEQTIVTNVTENESSDLWSIYPNPTEGLITIEGFSKMKNVSFTDINGRTISYQQVSENQIRMDAPIGIYIFKGNKDGKAVVTRILKR